MRRNWAWFCQQSVKWTLNQRSSMKGSGLTVPVVSRQVIVRTPASLDICLRGLSDSPWIWRRRPLISAAWCDMVTDVFRDMLVRSMYISQASTYLNRMFWGQKKMSAWSRVDARLTVWSVCEMSAAKGGRRVKLVCRCSKTDKAQNPIQESYAKRSFLASWYVITSEVWVALYSSPCSSTNGTDDSNQNLH